MKQLTKGKINTKELADWFGHTYNTYRHKKSELLKHLKDYCSFTEVYGGIIVTEVFLEEYEGDISGDVKEYLEQVKIYPLNSISNIACSVAEKPEYSKLSECQLKRRMAKAGVIGFGVTAEEDSKGIYGVRNYQWSIKLPGSDKPYRNLNEEEQVIFNELTAAVFGEKTDIIQKMALLDSEFERTCMTKEEYLNHKDRLNFVGTFDQIIYRFKQETGKQLVRATSHECGEQVM